VAATLTERKKNAAAEKATARAAASAPKTPVSVLKKYAPVPPEKFCRVAWDSINDGLVVELSENHHTTIPASARGAEILLRILRSRYAASVAAATPMLGSETYPTQAQVNGWLKMKADEKIVISAERVAASRAAVEIDEEMGV
jgi:hypothetical protein